MVGVRSGFGVWCGAADGDFLLTRFVMIDASVMMLRVG